MYRFFWGGVHGFGCRFYSFGFCYFLGLLFQSPSLGSLLLERKFRNRGGRFPKLGVIFGVPVETIIAFCGRFGHHILGNYHFNP